VLFHEILCPGMSEEEQNVQNSAMRYGHKNRNRKRTMNVAWCMEHEFLISHSLDYEEYCVLRCVAG
jgi:hypothetical protein